MTTAGSSEKKTLTVDIRVFLLVTVSAMAIAFGVGVAMGPTAADIAAAAASRSKLLPEVHSVDFSEQLQGTMDKEDDPAIHEPAGQVSRVLSMYLIGFDWILSIYLSMI
jgi:hypothetical protein